MAVVRSFEVRLRRQGMVQPIGGEIPKFFSLICLGARVILLDIGDGPGAAVFL